MRASTGSIILPAVTVTRDSLSQSQSDGQMAGPRKRSSEKPRTHRSFGRSRSSIIRKFSSACIVTSIFGLPTVRYSHIVVILKSSPLQKLQRLTFPHPCAEPLWFSISPDAFGSMVWNKKPLIPHCETTNEYDPRSWEKR